MPLAPSLGGFHNYMIEISKKQYGAQCTLGQKDEMICYEWFSSEFSIMQISIQYYLVAVNPKIKIEISSILIRFMVLNSLKCLHVVLILEDFNCGNVFFWQQALAFFSKCDEKVRSFLLALTGFVGPAQ